MTVGKRIREIRKKFNLTQSEFAKKVNVSSQVISNWEREYTKPNSEDIQRIASTLDINTEYLYGRTNDPSPSEKSLDVPFDSLDEINKLIKKHGIEQMGFFNIEEWKNLGPTDVKLIEEHFKMIVKLAKERNEEKK